MKKLNEFFDETGRFIFVSSVIVMILAHGFCFMNLMYSHDSLTVVNGRFCPQSVRSFCPIVAGFNAGTYKVPACVL